MFHNLTTKDIFPYLLSRETVTGTQTHDSSSDPFDLGLRQKPKIDSQENEFSPSEITLRSLDERIKQAIYPILRHVEEICVL